MTLATPMIGSSYMISAESFSAGVSAETAMVSGIVTLASVSCVGIS